ncbi:hypothetical protein ACTQ49_07345 [Luteococcus sp. Sow4_B9]|uniref:hypothetical protein n=1 Tax=Luteococcus sp. Sow4_B9 TaxID=3438792 RepID=UPI003F960AE8
MELVKNLPECDNPETKAPYVALHASDDPSTCTSQGVFVAERVEELPVGQRLSAHGTTCTVVARGSVQCSSQLGSLVANPQEFKLEVNP